MVVFFKYNYHPNRPGGPLVGHFFQELYSESDAEFVFECFKEERHQLHVIHIHTPCDESSIADSGSWQNDISYQYDSSREYLLVSPSGLSTVQ